jgi:hypothetical protein
MLETVKALNVVRTYEMLAYNGSVVYGISINCSDYSDYKVLPAAVKFNNRTYGKAGWNSDTGLCEYRSDRLLAFY